jgi:hypothetical protein
MQTVALASIKVEDRCRKDLGDVTALARSIETVGLLHPPVVTPDLRLIAGERRLAAIRSLGWTNCPVTVADGLTETLVALQAERDENTCRKDLVPTEIEAIGERIWAVERPKAEERQAEGQCAGGHARQGSLVETCHHAAKTRDVVAQAVGGVSGRTYEKIKAVVEAAKAEPEKFAPVVAEMDRTGKVDRAFKVVKQVKQAEARAAKAAEIDLDPALTFGDFRELGTNLPDCCADLVFTDPPYDEDAVALYRDLGIFASRVLKPGGLCLAYSGHAFLPQVMNALSESLTYGWTCAIRHTGGELRFRNLHVRNAWKPVVLFYKPPLEAWWDWFSDMTSGGREKDEHDWQQAEAEAAHYIAALCPKGGLVVDPFAGGGTTLVAAKKLGLKYIGYEVAQEAFNAAQVRLSK